MKSKHDADDVGQLEHTKKDRLRSLDEPSES